MKQLAVLEQKLPAFWKQAAAGPLTLALLVLVGLFGIGGTKLAVYRQQVVSSFSAGEKSMAGDLNERVGAAANVVTVAQQLQNLDGQLLEQARQAVQAFEQAQGPAALYKADQQLEAAIETLYQQAKAQAQQKQAELLSEQYMEFKSRGTILRNGEYNRTAQAFNQTLNQFPANLLGAGWGLDHAECFA